MEVLAQTNLNQRIQLQEQLQKFDVQNIENTDLNNILKAYSEREK